MFKQTQKFPKELVTIAWVLVLGTMAPMLDSTMVNIAINQLGQEFQASLGLVQWVMISFILAMGAAVPFSSWLVDRFSGRTIYLWSEIGFGLASLLAGLSANIYMLISMRIIQGLFSGLLITVMFTLLVELFGGAKMGQVMSIIGVPMTLGPMLGPIFGGLIVQTSSWRWMFFVNVPIVMIAIIGLIRMVPKSSPQRRLDHFDFLGITLLVVIAVSLILGITKASMTGTFLQIATLRLVGIGLLASIIYVFYALKTKYTVVLPLHLFKYRNFSGAMLGDLLAGFITTGPMLLFPLYFQDVRGDSLIIAAIALIPQSLGMLMARGMIGRMIDQLGARIVIILGVIITVIGTLPLVYLGQTTASWLLMLIMFIRGIGGAGVKSALQADVYVGIDKIDVGAASIGAKLFEQVGSAFGAAVLATLVTGYTVIHPINQSNQLIGAYQHGFLYATIFSLLILIPAFMMTNRVKK